VRLTFLILTLLIIVAICGCRNTPIDKGNLNSVKESEIIDFTLEDISIPVGTTVVWTNIDNKSHTTTSGVPPEVSGIWDSPFLEENQKFSFTFDEVGEFHYWCRVHPFMMARVNVKD
tara:strand:- start:229 stop:579 length:351 start_codon:yes stop_codon:yes gene_type:complete